MPRGQDPYVFHDEENELIELGYQDWYEHPGYQMSHQDWCNTIKQHTLNYADFLEFWHSEKAKPWEDEIKRRFSDRCDIAKPWIDKSRLVEQVRKDVLSIVPSDDQSWDKKYKSKLIRVLRKIVSDTDKPTTTVWK